MEWEFGPTREDSGTHNFSFLPTLGIMVLDFPFFLFFFPPPSASHATGGFYKKGVN